jgi:hypothetical protein
MNMNKTSRQPLKSLAALAALALLATAAVAEPARKNDKPKPETAAFRSGGTEVAVECFAPHTVAEHPVVVTLHAVDGIDGDCARLYRTAAKDYGGRGYVVLLVHYCDRTGAAKKDVAAYCELFANYYQRKEHKADDLKRINSYRASVWPTEVSDCPIRDL